MANITEYLKNIMSARFGREVRGSIHDAIAAINEESTNAAASAAQAASAAKNAVNATDEATESANTAAASANEAAEKANAAASGDLSEKTTTYTESTTASPPTSGSKLPAIIGWCIGKIKALVTDVSSLNSKMENYSSISIDEFFSTLNAIVRDDVESQIFRKGNHIYGRIYFKGSIISSEDGVFYLGNVVEKYRPHAIQMCGTMVNNSCDGHFYTPASFQVSNTRWCGVMLGERTAQYGNDVYPWCTTEGLIFNYEL